MHDIEETCTEATIGKMTKMAHNPTYPYVDSISTRLFMLKKENFFFDTLVTILEQGPL